jgi:hypothetical protein
MNMKRLVVFGMVFLVVAFTAYGCASQPNAQGGVNATNNKNYRATGGGGNGLF